MSEKRKIIRVYQENSDKVDTLTKLLLKYIELKKEASRKSNIDNTKEAKN